MSDAEMPLDRQQRPIPALGLGTTQILTTTDGNADHTTVFASETIVRVVAIDGDMNVAIGVNAVADGSDAPLMEKDKEVWKVPAGARVSVVPQDGVTLHKVAVTELA